MDDVEAHGTNTSDTITTSLPDNFTRKRNRITSTPDCLVLPPPKRTTPAYWNADYTYRLDLPVDMRVRFKGRSLGDHSSSPMDISSVNVLTSAESPLANTGTPGAQS